jgi:hypothetical protein
MSRYPEQLVWDALRLRAAPRFLLQRHEDRFSAGIPDLSGLVDRVSFWCELKSSPPTGRLRLRQRQLNWMAARAAAGAVCLLLARRLPHEWAACLVTRENHEELSAGVDFAGLAGLGRFDTSPLPLVERLVLHDSGG